MLSSPMLGVVTGAGDTTDMDGNVDGPLRPADWDSSVSREFDGDPADSGATPRPGVAVE